MSGPRDDKDKKLEPQESRIAKSEWKTAHGPIKLINFKETPSLKDEYKALGCIAVLTSDGQVGTLTHLGTEEDTKAFVDNLNIMLGAHQNNSAVILVGGSKRRESLNFEKKLSQELTSAGYSIVSKEPSLTLAPSGKIATLFVDKVTVTEKGRNKEISFLSKVEEVKEKVKILKTQGSNDYKFIISEHSGEKRKQRSNHVRLSIISERYPSDSSISSSPSPSPSSSSDVTSAGSVSPSAEQENLSPVPKESNKGKVP